MKVIIAATFLCASSLFAAAAGGHGSDVGTVASSPIGIPLPIGGNVIAFNGQMGVAVAAGLQEVSIRDNRIWGNGGLGIDIGLDGPTPVAEVPAPTITMAHYDPSTKQTVIDADISFVTPSYAGIFVDFYANDAVDASGYGEAQRPLGALRVNGAAPPHVRFTVDGDLTGQLITATTTRIYYQPFSKIAPQGVTSDFDTQTSEISRAIEVR